MKTTEFHAWIDERVGFLKSLVRTTTVQALLDQLQEIEGLSRSISTESGPGLGSVDIWMMKGFEGLINLIQQRWDISKLPLDPVAQKIMDQSIERLVGLRDLFKSVEKGS